MFLRSPLEKTMSTEKLRKQAITILAEQPLTLKEMAEKMGLAEKKTFSLLRNLFEKGRIKAFTDAEKKRRYTMNEAYQEGKDEGEEEIEPN